uniref:Zinc finger and SCAN domain-containing protein 5B n=1 Tax=Catagonus wagneri TaxID=51154 RepID=A0A8C3WEU8_9CETA
MAEQQTFFQGPESEPPVSVLRQGTLSEKPDRESETWHVRFRTFTSSEGSDPVQDLRRLRELCHLWLRPDLHTKEQIVDRLVLEQFLICMPLECQVLVQERGVESCRELEDMLINRQRPENCTIVHVGGQDFLVRDADVEMVATEASDVGDERDPRREPLSPVSEIHAENGQQGSRELQSFPDAQEPARGQVSDKKALLQEMTPDPRVLEGLTPKENMEQDLVGDKEDPRTPIQSQEPELRKGPGESGKLEFKEATEDAVEGGHRRSSGRRLTRSKRKRAHGLTSQDVLQEGAPSLARDGFSGPPRTHSVCSPSGVKTASHAEGKAAVAGTRYQCQECNKRFPYKSQLTLHKRTHTGERPFQCGVCAKGFMQPSDLRVHERVHTGEKPYRCDSCGRNFTHNSTLRAHKRTHSKEKPFPCEQCDMAFSHRGNLNVHRRTHSGLKPYVCPVCQGAFRQLGTFKRHQKTHFK